MAPRSKDSNPSGLGRAIINQKVKDARRQHESGMYSQDIASSTRLKSVTYERDLDEFLNNAQLAGTDFTAERRNVKIIQQTANTSQNPYLLSQQEEQKLVEKHMEHKQRLRVPRRPPWTKLMTAADLEKQEKAAFLEWRRGVAELQDNDKFLLTPFERNLEVWRQLWRVLERSHLLVQIVDARNPLRFRCEDLEDYVVDVEGNEGEAGTGKGKRRTLLLINKADLLTHNQRSAWASYLEKQSIPFAFFSAAEATALQSGVTEPLSDSGGSDNDDGFDGAEAPEPPSSPDNVRTNTVDSPPPVDPYEDRNAEATAEAEDARTKVLTVQELEALFLRVAPNLQDFADPTGKAPEKLVVGLVGYPNVGKSSTINSLLGEKKVSVSSTPGKTKHFQTIHLSDQIILCDCPGLVFPQFATTKADLICDGVLPIDQMKEHTGPVALLVQRVPKDVLEATYGLTLHTRPQEEGGDGKVTAENLLVAYAIARGFMRSGQGNPDEARAARYILKDYVNAKLLYCHPPPGHEGDVFNEKAYESLLAHLSTKKRAPTTRVGQDADTYIPVPVGNPGSPTQGLKSRALDKEFFANGTFISDRPFIQGSHGQSFTRATLFPHQNIVANDGTPLVSEQARLAVISTMAAGNGKHHKKAKRVKQRSGKGYE
ncbi:P-loop containing nucleoside triphosphate hydrolase protein [Pluteus cervinus]|uniref:P-loop containing nucleoside triphosphate hydrolase protein n=1 Tax=Pluteus cervinus TaxID=181527 RepID=A0ACD3BJA9_9AGAR|nr:P-loop containing nucleoside triphosphate hydrolase protein [Pluteus cervinus]